MIANEAAVLNECRNPSATWSKQKYIMVAAFNINRAL